MNTTTTVEANAKPQERRNSHESHVSNNSDNPLMRLVDAALAPEVNKPEVSSTTGSSCDHVKSNKGAEPEIKPSNSHEEVKTTTPQEQQPQDDDENATQEEAKVIRGTVEDLVSRQDKKLTFAEYLMQCLNDEANHDVLQWMPCGLQFTITNHRKFTMERMPALFKIRNMSSFVRKLTRWGFNRVHEKETGNSDIFKHPLFQRDKPELCKKIRCVNRASQQQQQQVMHHHHKPMIHMMHPGVEMMGNLSESSMRSGGMHHPGDMHMVSPRRSMGHVNHHYGGGRPPMPHNGPPPPSYMSRFPHQQQTPGGPGPRHHPRVSPEYEKEMIANSNFPPRHPGPPQVYSPPTIGRSMSAAAEYELEQVLLERQRARAAMYREQHQQQQQQGNPSSSSSSRQQGSSPTAMNNNSERSMGTTNTGGGSHNTFGGPDGSSPTMSKTTSSVVTAALETLQREGEYDLDMSPREAMLRAVLHKRQQQRNQQQRTNGGGPPPRYDNGPPPSQQQGPVHYYC